MKGDGLYRRGEVWWMTWVTPDGKRHQASTGKHYHAEAKEVRNRIVGDISHGRPVPLPRKLTLGDLRTLIEADYKMRGRRSLKRVQGALKHLMAYFGAQRVAGLSWGDTMQYREQRAAAGRKPATINYELAILRHMLRLAVKDGTLATVPVIETPDPKNARQGFFERDEFEMVLGARDTGSGERMLPESYAAVARYGYCTGWRVRSEVLPLQWEQIDFGTGEIRLEAHTTKSGKPRVFVFDAWPELAELLAARRAATDAVIRETGKRVPWVFHEEGRPIPYKKLLRAWRAACVAAEVPPRLLHDLRRTAARNFRRAGVDEGTIMDLCGWENRAMFDRYNIIDQRDRRAAVEKRAGVSELQSSDNPTVSPA